MHMCVEVTSHYITQQGRNGKGKIVYKINDFFKPMLFVVSVVNYTQMAKEVIKRLLNHYASLNVAELPAESNTSFFLVSEMIPEQEEFGGDVKFSFIHCYKHLP